MPITSFDTKYIAVNLLTSMTKIVRSRANNYNKIDFADTDSSRKMVKI